MSEERPSLAAICWLTTAILAGFMCFGQFGMMLGILIGRTGIAGVAPAALVLAVIVGDRFGRRMGLQGLQRLWPPGLALGVIALSIALSAYYFDLSWDGQWYHQTGVYALGRDWNPFTDPLRRFPQHLQDWVRHYAKGPWYVGAAIYETSGQIEWGKCTAAISLAAMALAVFAAGLDCGLRRSHAAAIALLVAVNPVVMSEVTSYLVDGIVIAFLTVVAAAVFSVFRRPQPVVVLIGIMGTIISINAKFTGLVFVCFIFAAGGLWCMIRRREWLLRYTALTLLSLVLGVVVFGYNPYLTNTIYRHHPFYPVLGTAAFPPRAQNDIDRYETPKNFLGHNRLFRLVYTTFARPGNQPWHNEPNATLMWPFAARPADLFYYKYHEARVSGFGPYFSGALLLSFGLGVWLLLRPGASRWILVLAAVAILGSLLIAPHLWWPRYGPQLWLLPIVPVVFVFWIAHSRWAIGAAWVLAALLGLNASIVAVVRMNWETMATQTLRHQLTELHQSSQEIAISFPYFEVSGEERLKTWGVRYQKKGRNEIRNGPVLMSVVEGYPGAVHYRVLASGDQNVPGSGTFAMEPEAASQKR